MPLVLLGLAVVLVWFGARSTRGTGPIAWLGLATLWLWSGIAYHLLHFGTINSMAYVFGGLFVIQGLLFARMAGAQPVSTPARGLDVAGVILLLYALVAYPAIGLVSGKHYPAMPTFGAPCPVAIYTFGPLVALRRPLPLHLLLIPSAWALIATFAALSLGVLQDLALPVAAVTALALLHTRRKHALGLPEPRLHPIR